MEGATSCLWEGRGGHESTRVNDVRQYDMFFILRIASAPMYVYMYVPTALNPACQSVPRRVAGDDQLQSVGTGRSTTKLL